MNIIIYADDFYQEYKRGIANYGFNLIKALKENNHKVYIYSRGESDLRKKQLNNLSYRIAFANELLKEIIYFGKYSLRINNKSNKKKISIIKRLYFNFLAFFSLNTLVKYEAINLHFNSTENNPQWDGFYNDKLFRFKAYFSKKLKRPLKFKVPNSIDFVISISPQNIKVTGAPLLSIFHDALPIISPHHLEENSKKAYIRFSAAIKNSFKILHVSQITKKNIELIFSKQLTKKSSNFSKFVGQPLLNNQDIDQFFNAFHNYKEQSFFIKKDQSPAGNFIDSEINIPYIVNLGAIETRKNQTLLLNHLRPLIKERKIRLVFIGKSAENDYYNNFLENIKNINEFDSFKQIRERNDYRNLKINKSGKNKDKISKKDLKPYKSIILLEDLDNLNIKYVLQGALCLVQYSSQEGFGIPLVEASKNLCPAISSKIDIFSEVGDFIQVDYNDPKSLLTEVNKLLGINLSERKELILKQFKSVRKHNYKTYNDLLLNIIK